VIPPNALPPDDRLLDTPGFERIDRKRKWSFISPGFTTWKILLNLAACRESRRQGVCTSAFYTGLLP
jgi:hypothetical protein